MPPLTPAEKQRRYKEKLKKDPIKYEEYKRKKRENYHAKKRLVQDLTPKEKFNARVIWKLRKRNLRRNKKNLKSVLDYTPPSSPLIVQEQVRPIPIVLEQPQSPISTKAKRGRNKVKRNRSKVYLENLKLKDKIENLKKKCDKYRKRCQRTEAQYKPTKNSKPNEEIKYKKLTNAIKERYTEIKKTQEKKLIKSIFDKVDVFRKDEMVKESLGLSGKLRTNTKVRNTDTELKKTLRDFFVRDDISRATAGKKETVTRNKTKVQKRFLLDTMKNLYKVFKQEKPDTKCSYYYFTKNKPFFIVKPSVDGREMCLCKSHVNIAYKAQALKRRLVIQSDDLNTLIVATVCDTTCQACMYGTCQKCGNSQVKYDLIKDTDNINWFEWGRQEEIYEKDGKIIKAVKNVKLRKEGLVKHLMESFNREFKGFKTHVYNMKTQFKNFRLAVNNLQMNEVLIVADFSENYNCKHYEEIQAHHFGGSRKQVTLHTVVVYVRDNDSKQKVESYCTISPSTNHQPAAIWAHLHPILTNIRNKYPDKSTIHFYSDGPFSQYRQKQNFYFCSTKLFDYGFSAMSWSFFEAGHGKGPADGVGGFLKRKADNIVATGRDIVCAEQFYEALKDQSKIRLFLITAEEIDGIAKQLPSNVLPLKGTLHVHQVFTKVRGQLSYRNLSCFCNRSFCTCLQPKIYQPIACPVSEIKCDDVTLEDVDDTNIEDIYSSDDDIPITYFKSSNKSPLNEVKLIDLTKPHNKNMFNLVYHSEDDQPCTSSFNGQNKENRGVQCGDFLIVNVHAIKGKIYRYACLVHNLDDDGDIFVTFLRNVKHAQLFRLDKTDVSFIDYRDIVNILEKPKTFVKRGQTYYDFNNPIDIYEN